MACVSGTSMPKDISQVPGRRKGLTPQQRRWAAENSNDVCFYCCRAPGPQWCTPYEACGHEHHEALTVDHLLPVARGGGNERGNLVLACGSCNSSKGSKTLLEWDGPPHLRLVA